MSISESWTFRGGTPDSLRAAQRAIIGANHLVFIYPLLLGTMPALLKAFLEQVFRPDVAVKDDKGALEPLFKGKTARMIVTMGMPALVYRWYFLAHSLKSLERNILGSSGVRPIRTTIFGSVDKAGATGRVKWLEKVKSLGALAH